MSDSLKKLAAGRRARLSRNARNFDKGDMVKSAEELRQQKIKEAEILKTARCTVAGCYQWKGEGDMLFCPNHRKNPRRSMDEWETRRPGKCNAKLKKGGKRCRQAITHCPIHKGRQEPCDADSV